MKILLLIFIINLVQSLKCKKRLPKIVIFMISDGFGPQSNTFGRTIYQLKNKLPFNHKTPLDEILTGSSRTHSNNSLITDSAAGATAFSCGLKTYNNAVGGIN